MAIFLFLCMMIIPAGAAAGTIPDSLVSGKALGCTVAASGTTFRLFAPRATHVALVLYDRVEDEEGQTIPMVRDTHGVWEYHSLGKLTGKCYGYRVAGPQGPGEMFDSTIVIADPYSRAVASRAEYHQRSKTLILDTSYKWEGDTWIAPADHNSLVIYEAHLRDLTAHPSSGVKARGTYAGLLEKGKTGGLSYLKELGVNAVEFLPLQKFGVTEIPYKDSSVADDNGETNTWNPYERNHWGYMTSYLFAPEPYYASDGTLQRGAYSGAAGRAVREFKDLVKGLHREGIAVLMDVVYNHVSQYDYNPFKYIDKRYYFRLDSAGRFIKASGCGNDFKTESPMARRLIVESVKYWMREYHIDGFRFDLATLIDRETCREIIAEARKINPNVIIIAEAWGGGGYDPPGFSDLGWASWNDQIRNGVKGQNPDNGLGFIFGKFQDKNTKKRFQSYLTGTLREDGGMYVKKEHSINYLESHDDNTLGDFIRLGTGEAKQGAVIADRDANAALSPRQLALNKLAALYLFASQGPIMIHEGQEYARSKVIAAGAVPDPQNGTIDHNSYNKDNETNYLNYAHRDLNRGLFDYYRGLIGLRKARPALANAGKKAVTFFDTKDDFFIAFKVKPAGKAKPMIVLLNGNPEKAGSIKLPKGAWSVLADGTAASATGLGTTVSGTIAVPPTSGMILTQ
jgi:pullulanase/glycogen debranching enzyme